MGQCDATACAVGCHTHVSWRVRGRVVDADRSDWLAGRGPDATPAEAMAFGGRGIGISIGGVEGWRDASRRATSPRAVTCKAAIPVTPETRGTKVLCHQGDAYTASLAAVPHLIGWLPVSWLSAATMQCSWSPASSKPGWKVGLLRSRTTFVTTMRLRSLVGPLRPALTFTPRHRARRNHGRSARLGRSR